MMLCFLRRLARVEGYRCEPDAEGRLRLRFGIQVLGVPELVEFRV